MTTKVDATLEQVLIDGYCVVVPMEITDRVIISVMEKTEITGNC